MAPFVQRCRRRPVLATLLIVVLGGCEDARHAWARLRGTDEPVELPALLTTELPFQYPPALYAMRVPGDVTLELHVDSLGHVVPESTRVAEHAAHAAFDSAALEGASRLLFRPARRGEKRLARTVLFPIKFRVPSAPTPPRDTMRIRR